MSLRAQIEALRVRITQWQDDNTGGYDQAIGLLCEAADVLALLPSAEVGVRQWLKARIQHYRAIEAANPYTSGNDGLHDDAEQRADMLGYELALLEHLLVAKLPSAEAPQEDVVELPRGVLTAMAADWLKLEQERDDLKVAYTPNDGPGNTDGRLLLNAYGRTCYEAGVKSAESRIAQLEQEL